MRPCIQELWQERLLTSSQLQEQDEAMYPGAVYPGMEAGGPGYKAGARLDVTRKVHRLLSEIGSFTFKDTVHMMACSVRLFNK
jgi:hypothetical protein